METEVTFRGASKLTEGEAHLERAQVHRVGWRVAHNGGEQPLEGTSHAVHSDRLPHCLGDGREGGCAAQGCQSAISRLPG